MSWISSKLCMVCIFWGLGGDGGWGMGWRRLREESRGGRVEEVEEGEEGDLN